MNLTDDILAWQCRKRAEDKFMKFSSCSSRRERANEGDLICSDCNGCSGPVYNKDSKKGKIEKQQAKAKPVCEECGKEITGKGKSNLCQRHSALKQYADHKEKERKDYMEKIERKAEIKRSDVIKVISKKITEYENKKNELDKQLLSLKITLDVFKEEDLPILYETIK
jgi:hypothetical protein